LGYVENIWTKIGFVKPADALPRPQVQAS